MIPPFDIEGGLPLASARFMSVAGLIGAFGSLFYARVLRPDGLLAETGAQIRRLGFICLAWALAGALVWLVAQTVDFAGGFTLGDFWATLTQTGFGHLLLSRLAALGVAALALRLGYGAAAAGLAGVALLLQAGHSHAAAMGGSPILLASAGLHLLAAGIWLGGLPALWMALSDSRAGMGFAAARRFSPAAMGCVAVLLLTAAWQFSVLIMGLPGLFGTAYGWMAGLKMLLLAALLVLAYRNKFRLTPALEGAHAATPARDLRRAIIIETTLGLAAVAAAAVLTELQPAMHVQPLWPFSERLSTVTIDEDPEFLRTVVLSALALAAGAAMLAAALYFRRYRPPAIIASAIIVWFAVPNFSLLLAEADPYSFYHSPTGFAAASIVEGASLYPGHCAACHGASGRGDGPLAGTLPVPPADLTADHVWMHSDGDLFSWLTNGIKAPRGGQAMPGFADTLSPDERWALIDYIRAHNAGMAMVASGHWSPPLQAPDFSLTCEGRSEKLADLRGMPARLVIGGSAPVSAAPGLVTILADAPAMPAAGVCLAGGGAVAQAYAIVSGAAPSGTQFLIDGDGWLRAMQHAGASDSWNDPKSLAASLAAMRTQKVAPKGPAPMSVNMPM